MEIQIIHHKMPPAHRRIPRHGAGDMGREVRFGTRRPDRRAHHLPTGHVAINNEGACTMPDVLKFPPFDVPRLQRQAGMLAFQRLHARQFIGREHPFPRLRQKGRLGIQLTDIAHLGVEGRIDRGRQPVAEAVRLEIPLLSRRAAWRGEIWATMPRATISSATSRADQWLIGRPLRLGASQARASIRQTASAVIWAGRPARGISVKRSATLSSVSGMGCKPSQRRRQRRAVSTVTLNWRASWALLAPVAAAKTSWARKASCWGVRWARVRASNSWCSVPVSESGGGLGPRMGYSSA